MKRYIKNLQGRSTDSTKYFHLYFNTETSIHEMMHIYNTSPRESGTTNY